jgi:tetratricopeptide (TPR) repeat protein
MHSAVSFRSFLSFALLSSLFIIPSLAQQGTAPPAGAGNTGTGATGSVGPGTPGRANTPIQQPSQQTMDPKSRFPEMQRQNIFLSGKVILDDGTPPPEPLLIERVCNGAVRPEGYTDSKGRFSFQLGQNSNVMMDASMSSSNGNDVFDSRNGSASTTNSQSPMGSAPVSLMGCELRASLPGFRSDVVSLHGRRSLDNPDVGTIVLHRLGKVDGYTFSGTSTYAPKDARKAYEKGKEAVKKQKWPEAEKELQKAVDIYPKYAVAWYELGMVHQAQKNVDEAKKAYAQSLAADSKYISPYSQLAWIAAVEKNWKDAAEYTDKLLKLNPYFSPDAYYVNSISYLNMQNLDRAEEGAREALKLDANHRNPKINQLLGVILAQKQDYPGAAENMRTYLKLAPNATDAGSVKLQLTEVEKLLGAKADTTQRDPEKP